ncbi:MAG: AI-2E family transporter, partial [Candidatus Auribacterota bacterium]|nr:AI-2E family transporter [Candidatus Auribacterota bacterium]
ILIPFALAIFLAYILYPVVNLLTKMKIPYGVAVAIVLILVLAIFFAAGAIIGNEITGFVRAVPKYQEQLKELAENITSTYTNFLERFADALPGDKEISAPAEASSRVRASSILSGVIGNLFTGLLSVFSLLQDFIMVFLFLIFLLAGAKKFKKKLISAWDTGEKGKSADIIKSINEGIGGYIIIRSALNLGLAAVITVVLLIFGVDYAFVWGPLTGILNFIPYVGAFLAIIPPVTMAYFQFDSHWTAMALFLVIIVIQNTEGNIITPYFIGRRVNQNPLTVLLGLMLWGFIWGPVGMILATPLTTCIQILCDNIEPLKPIGKLLGGDDRVTGSSMQ